jgi:hypothetical protein
VPALTFMSSALGRAAWLESVLHNHRVTGQRRHVVRSRAIRRAWVPNRPSRPSSSWPTGVLKVFEFRKDRFANQILGSEGGIIRPA